MARLRLNITSIERHVASHDIIWPEHQVGIVGETLPTLDFSIPDDVAVDYLHTVTAAVESEAVALCTRHGDFVDIDRTAVGTCSNSKRRTAVCSHRHLTLGMRAGTRRFYRIGRADAAAWNDISRFCVARSRKLYGDFLSFFQAWKRNANTAFINQQTFINIYS